MIKAVFDSSVADYLVARDKDLLSLGAHENIQIVTPEAFLGIVSKIRGAMNDVSEEASYSV